MKVRVAVVAVVSARGGDAVEVSFGVSKCKAGVELAR